MVKANVIPGKFLSCLLGIFIGILLTLGGLVGGGFYVYKNVKVGSLLGLLPQETDNWLSDEYAQNTIEGLVKELQSLANGDITLEKVAQISPAAGDKIDEVLDNVNQNGIVTLDRDALYKTPINQLTSNLMDVVIITSTLDSLSETMNFALPDMPLITGGGQDKEVWVYTAVNDNETHTIDKAIALGDYTYYTRSSKYERVTEEKITSLYSLSGVVTDENGYLKKDGKFIYARDVVQGDSGETYRYTKLERDSKLIDAADSETYTFLTDQLFFKNGPDGEYTKLTLTDGGSRTVYAVPSAYAYRLLYAEQGDGYVLATKTDEGGNPVSGSGGFEILTQFENVHLFAETDVYDEVTEPTEEIVRNNLLFVKTDGIGSLPVNYGITALSGALDVNTLTLNKVGEYFGISLTNDILKEITDVPLGYMSESMQDAMQNIQLASVLKLDGSSSSILLYLAYGEKGIDYTVGADNQIVPVNEPKTITEVMNSIDTIKIGNIVEIDENSHSLMQAIQDWSIDDFGKADKINSLKLGDVIAVIEDSPQILKALKNVTLGGFSEAIDALTLEDMLGEIEESNTILYALKDCTINTLASSIGSLAVQDLFANDIYEYHKLSENEDFSKYPNDQLFVWEDGKYQQYDDSRHDADAVYARYPIGYDGTNYISGYENIPLYAYKDGEYVLATETTGWKLPVGAANTNYYYRDTNGKYVLAETQNGVYTHAVLYYLDAQEELAEIQLVPAELSIKAEFKTSVLYSKFKFAVNDGGYDFANLYYFDYDNSAFKRVETTYNAETGKYTVSAGDADKTLYTHGKAVGVWKYLLTDKDGMEMICTVNNIGSLVANVSYNVNHAKLKDLNADGLINVTSENGADIFSTPIPESISPTHTATTLGELTIGDAINVIVTVLNMIPHL